MKKITYFLIATLVALFSFSCSSDDDSVDVKNPGNSYLKVTIDGKEKVFNTIAVNKMKGTFGVELLGVTASIDNNPTEIINFTVEKDQVGLNAIYYGFKYIINNKEYQDNSSNSERKFSSIFSKNSDNNLEGTFYGKLYLYDGGYQDDQYKEFTKGELKIKY